MVRTDLRFLVNAPIPRILESDLLAHDVFQHFAERREQSRFLDFLRLIGQFDAASSNTEDAGLQELVDFVMSASAVLHRVPRECAEVLVQLATTRCFLVVRYVSQNNPHFLDSLVSLVKADGGADPCLAAIRNRFEIFSNAWLLADIFSDERRQRIASIMESSTDD